MITDIHDDKADGGVGGGMGGMGMGMKDWRGKRPACLQVITGSNSNRGSQTRTSRWFVDKKASPINGRSLFSIPTAKNL